MDDETDPASTVSEGVPVKIEAVPMLSEDKPLLSEVVPTESEAASSDSDASIDENSTTGSYTNSSDSDYHSNITDTSSKTKRGPISDSKKKIKCHHCNKGFISKKAAHKHSCKCKKSVDNTKPVMCSWCNLEFRNRGNLAKHTFHLHGDSSYQTMIANENALKRDPRFNCNVCQRNYTQKYQLRYHIRKMHFNLLAKRPYAELKRVNQVWFEKVMNSNNIMEIKKTGKNTLVMRKLAENTAIKVRDVDTEIIDLSELYPTDTRQKKDRVPCDICHGMYYKRDLSKHKQEVHMKITKHLCNNCNRHFKRSYQYLQHVCNKKVKVKGVRNSRHNDIKISSVESLSMPWA